MDATLNMVVPFDLVTCRVCDEPMTSPRKLPCYHTICSDCLEEHIQQNLATGKPTPPLTFPCPLCSQTIKIPDADNLSLDHQSYAQRFEPDHFIDRLCGLFAALRDDSRPCDLCRRRDIKQTGDSWCLDCLDVICQSCLKVHLAGKTTAEHTVIPLTELRKMSPDNVLRRGLLHQCREHRGEAVRFYCMDCRVPVCVQCLTLSHRKCDNCIPIADAMALMKEPILDVMARIRSAIKSESESESKEGGRSREEVNVFQTSAQILEESVKEAEEKIRSLASELRQSITDQEQALLERLHQVASQLHEKVGDFQDTPLPRNEETRILSSAHARMESLMKYGSDAELLELFGAVQSPLSRLDSLDISASTVDDEVNLSVKFNPSDLVQAFRRDFGTLGEVLVQDSTSEEGLSSWGVTVTASEEIVVVDCRNRRVQKFALSGELLDHIQISAEPRDVTSCGRRQQKQNGGQKGRQSDSEEVAVTLMGKQVYIITVGDKMALKRRFKTPKQYDSIAYSAVEDANSSGISKISGGFFLVSSLDEKCVDVISTDGDVITSFGGINPTTKESLFHSPRYVAVLRDGLFAVSDGGQSCVVCFNQDGGPHFRYAPDGLHRVASPQGVCADKFGNLFLADFGNSRVHMISRDGELDRFVLGSDSGLRRPVAVSMTPGSNKLVIVQSDGVVKVFSYTETKVKMKVPCWCPRCSTSTDDGEDETQQGQGIQKISQRLRTSSTGGNSVASSGSGSRIGNRTGSESHNPFSPTSPTFPSHINGRAKRF